MRLLISILLATAITAVGQQVQFNRDIRPILSDNCFKCHGPDRNMRKAKLRLDLAEEAYRAREDTTPIVPGKPSDSEVVRRILATDPDDLMPPPKTGKQLTPEQKRLIETWVAQGAKYEGHWAFTPPTRPPLPSADPEWCRNPIDHFIRARLDSEKLAPSPEADRRTLIRRVSLDLTGLPPTPEAVEEFVRSRDLQAYAKLVRRLLQSERFGERMAVHWLDLVRYADTVGFHGDMPVSVWPYRDYVIGAFNDNMPFDRFTREQLAGDLLPNATREQRIASAYNRLNRMSTEGGIQDKEYRAKYAADRVRTTSTVWMGATLACAECHDHKFDPYSTKDFYRFAAFFADLQEKGFYPNGTDKGEWGPAMMLADDSQYKKLDALETKLEQLRKQRDEIKDEVLASGRDEWQQRLSNLESNKFEWKVRDIVSATSLGGADLRIISNSIVQAEGPNPDNDTYVVTFQPGAGEWTGVRLETLTDESLPGNRVARGGVGYCLTEVELHAEENGDARKLDIDGGSASLNETGFPFVAAFDGYPRTGWGMRLGGSRRAYAAFTFAEPVRAGSNTLLCVTLRHDSLIRRATVGKFRLAVTDVPNPTHHTNGVPDDVLKALRVPIEERSPKQQKKIAEFYRTIAPELRALNRQITAVEAQRSLLIDTIPTVLVSEATTPRTMRVLPRGDWMNDSGEKVEPWVPAFLKPFETPPVRATRLDLADWLTSPDNPLTARAVVNRFWKLFFGAGLSRTADDLGAQGEWPSHPDLLDWLAVEFRESGWDVKHIIELMVTSATYRQSSTGNKIAEERDPQNRLLARQARLRLEAEFIRDNALAIGGLLANKVSGPSVFPQQPEGYWAPLNFPKREYVLDRDDNLYRRGVYMHWQRTFLHPSLVAFDAPPREECTAMRPVSNTPLQALVLLNDPNFVEAAVALAQRMREHGGKTVESRIDWAYQRALARHAKPKEIAVLAEMYRKQVARHASEGKVASETMALTSVARAILNLHETITRY
jgi:hypothetical protein